MIITLCIRVHFGCIIFFLLNCLNVESYPNEQLAADGLQVWNQSSSTESTSQYFADVLNYNIENSNSLNVTEWDELRPRFWLYNRDNQEFHKEVNVGPGYFWNIDMISFNQRDTKVLIHGWDTTRFSRFSSLLKSTFLKELDVNVIVVDWSGLAIKPYSESMENLPKTAQYIREFLTYLVENHKLDLDKVHVIGFGLGAHLAGLACKKLTPKKVATITALDPVSLMSNKPAKKRLSPFDAKYVEAIHTGSRRFIGPAIPLGHADFYPNGGKLQPGCGIDLLASCSSERALDLYKASLETDRAVFMGVKCKNQLEAVQRRCSSIVKAKMGGKKVLRAHGIYFMETTGQPPFY